MKQAVAAVISKSLSTLKPLPAGERNQSHPQYNALREAILAAEQELRQLITGGEEEVHEWLAVIHYALADERARLLGS